MANNKTDDKNFGYAKKATTAIWHEEPTIANPYVASECRLHGYNMLELCKHKSFAEVLFLLFKGELPNPQQSELLEALLVAFINPGPRHPATRAAMTAGISKTNTPHILPIGLMVLGGQKNGSADVEQTMHFIKKHHDSPIDDFIEQNPMAPLPDDGQDWAPYPGVGSTYADIDPFTLDLANHFASLEGSAKSFLWLQQLIDKIDHPQVGWRSTGLFAAILLDLGIPAREGNALFQLISAPGLAAHGLEQTHKPIASMPFLDDNQYVLK
ncbi:MAG: citrate synthase [Phenylobacterium sp.]|jgi:citrate synthase